MAHTVIAQLSVGTVTQEKLGWKAAVALRRGSGELHALAMTDYQWLASYTGKFTVQDDSGKRFKARWEFAPTRPSERSASITGWALVDGKAGRLHICAHTPCQAMWPDSYYTMMPKPTHARLVPVEAAMDVGPAKEVTMSLPDASTACAPPAKEAPAPETKACSVADSPSALPESSPCVTPAAAGGDRHTRGGGGGASYPRWLALHHLYHHLYHHQLYQHHRNEQRCLEDKSLRPSHSRRNSLLPMVRSKNGVASGAQRNPLQRIILT